MIFMSQFQALLILLFQQYNKKKWTVNLFVDFNKNSLYLFIMDKKVFFNTTVPENLIKQFKILAIQLGKRQNELLIEAITDLLKKHDKPSKK